MSMNEFTNMANRKAADVDIRKLANKEPFLFFDKANVTTAGFSADDTFAMAKGAEAIGFSNPGKGTMTVEAQVVPIRFYALMSNGVVSVSGVKAVKETIKCSTGGKLTVTGADAGSVFVYKKGEVGGTSIAGQYTADTFTATQDDDIVANTEYDVCYLKTETTGHHRVSFNNKVDTLDYYVTMITEGKDETGALAAYQLTAYKAKPKKSFDVSWSSTGDPATVKIEFTCLEDSDGNVLDYDILDSADA